MYEMRLTRWDCDDGVSDRTTEVSLSRFLHLAENHGRNFLRSLENE